MGAALQKVNLNYPLFKQLGFAQGISKMFRFNGLHAFCDRKLDNYRIPGNSHPIFRRLKNSGILDLMGSSQGI